MQTTKTPTSHLKQCWADFRTENPKVRIRNAAEALGVSEAELVATGVGETTTRLKPEFSAIISELPALGRVMALTRSSGAVHEVSAPFGRISQRGQTVMYFRPGQDTRYFLDRWHSAFAVEENERLSLQFFDTSGEAVHKIYLLEDSDTAAYQALVVKFALEQQNAAPDDLVKVTTEPAEAVKEAVSIDEQALRQRWAAIDDVHESKQLIREYQGDSRAVYRALGEPYARLRAADCVEQLLNLLVEYQQECMIFGMNAHAVQSYSGPVNKLLRTGPWFNILDPGFNLHLRTDLIGDVWQVTRPSVDSGVTSIVVFDQQGQEMLVLTDNRSRGQEESEGWRLVLQQLDSAQ